MTNVKWLTKNLSSVPVAKSIAGILLCHNATRATRFAAILHKSMIHNSLASPDSKLELQRSLHGVIPLAEFMSAVIAIGRSAVHMAGFQEAKATRASRPPARCVFTATTVCRCSSSFEPQV